MLKTTVLYIFILLGLSSQSIAQTNQWTWLKGDTVYDALPRFGTQGQSGPSVNPPGITAPSYWTGPNGDLWMFGGRRRQTGGTSISIYSDLWRYRPGTGQWTWMKGSSLLNAPASYGVVGVENISNQPATSAASTTWVDSSGNLWMYGGFDERGHWLADLWRYNVVTNMWSLRPSGVRQALPVYGSRGVESSQTQPGILVGAVSWATPDGMFYLFGGQGNGPASSQTTSGYRNSLWRYNPHTGRWTWLKGYDNWQNGNFAPGQYGIIGRADTGNVPPGKRDGQLGWTDTHGDLWLFAQDMWRYSVSSGNWTCISRDTLIDKSRFDICYFSSHNKPKILFPTGNAGLGPTARWVDSSGRFWLFQGNGYRNGIGNSSDTNLTVNGLWCYDPALLRWAFVNGDYAIDSKPRWGVRGVSSPNVRPGDRGAPAAWYYPQSNSIYLYGGDYDTTTVTSPSTASANPTLNDMMLFRIDPACPSVRFQPQAGFRLAFDTVCAGRHLQTESEAHYADSVYYIGQGLRFDSAEGGPVLTQTGLISVRQVACNLNGCDTSAPQRVYVLQGNLSAQITSLPTSAFCSLGDTVQLRATANTSSLFQWYRADTLFAETPSIAIVDTGAWVVIASNSCAGASDTVRIYTDHTPRPDLGLDTLLCLNTQRLLDAGPGYASYRWSDGSSGQTLLVTAAGSYSVTTTSLAGCELADTIRLTADPCGVAVRKRRDTQLYPAPNPAKGILRLLGWQAGNKGILLDLTGKNIQTLSDQGEADVAPFSSGLYLWEVKTREGLVFRGRWAKE